MTDQCDFDHPHPSHPCGRRVPATVDEVVRDVMAWLDSRPDNILMRDATLKTALRRCVLGGLLLANDVTDDWLNTVATVDAKEALQVNLDRIRALASGQDSREPK